MREGVLTEGARNQTFKNDKMIRGNKLFKNVMKKNETYKIQ